LFLTGDEAVLSLNGNKLNGKNKSSPQQLEPFPKTATATEPATESEGGKTVLGTGILIGGSASLTTSTLPVGTSAIAAVYGGDSNFDSSRSTAVKQVVH
jgi:Bacterial Ig-like domain (group 3)